MILAGKQIPQGSFVTGPLEFEEGTIEGDVDLRKIKFDCLSFKKMTFDSLDLSGSAFETTLNFEKVYFDGCLCLQEISVDAALVLKEVVIGNFLNLRLSSIGTFMHLIKTSVAGNMFLSFKKGPIEILVDEEKAQLVHWSAPNTPLVVIKDEDTNWLLDH